MYAEESQIGQFKTCPDCGQQTEIKKVPKHQMTLTETTSADAYGVSQADETPRPTFRTLTDYRYVDGSLTKELHQQRYSGGNKIESVPKGRRKRNKQASHRSLERLELPKRPLTERFFVPFRSPDTWLPLIVFVAASLFVPIMLLLPLYILGAYGGIVSIIIMPFLFFMFIFIFGYFMSFAMYLYEFTSSGMDEGEFKGEIVLFDYFVYGLWLFAFSIIAATPGWLFSEILCKSLGFINDSAESAPWVVLMMRISHWIFFPIFFLSSMESGSMFSPFARNTIVSLYRQPFAWFRFYLLVGVLFVLSDLCLIVVAILSGSSELMFFVGIVVFFFLFAIQSLFFFRLLGRLAWLIEETDRRRRELEYEQE
jgi:hypothetical protein